VVSQHREVDASALAAAALVAQLLDLELSHELATRDDLVAVSVDQLARTWATLIDPRDAVLVVHSARAPEALADAVDELVEAWRGKGLRSGRQGTVARLRGPKPPDAPPLRLVQEEEKLAPLTVVPGGRGKRPIVMLGRVIPTPDPQSRARVRLAQRVLQEKLDARVLISGDVAVFALRFRLSSSRPGESLRRELERLMEYEEEGLRADRVKLAARLWLGARVVAASLDGEDWTALWSASIDLAGSDQAIPDALARDALAMLTTTPEQLGELMRAWLMPHTGEPGWRWVVAGLDAETADALAKEVKLEVLER
jgi:hypothetical protein